MNCQQFELYAAERKVDVGRTFNTVADIQTYVDALRDTPLWERNYPGVLRVEVYERPAWTTCSVGSWSVDHGAGKIEMHPAHFNELYVLHELAHSLARARYGSRAHDPWFARTYLELVYQAMGTEVYESLQRSFVKAGIDFEHDNSNPGGVVL